MNIFANLHIYMREARLRTGLQHAFLTFLVSSGGWAGRIGWSNRKWELALCPMHVVFPPSNLGTVEAVIANMIIDSSLHRVTLV